MMETFEIVQVIEAPTKKTKTWHLVQEENGVYMVLDCMFSNRCEDSLTMDLSWDEVRQVVEFLGQCLGAADNGTIDKGAETWKDSH